MANETNSVAVRKLTLAVFALIATFIPVVASAESTKTVDLDIRPGGVEQTFTETLKDYECSFTYASQGGTNEEWKMSVGLSEDDSMFSCSVWRPSGKSYLFFMKFKTELKGAKVEFAEAYSQISSSGEGDKLLKPEEFIVGDTTVTHTPQFKAQLAKVTVIGRTRHDEL